MQRAWKVVSAAVVPAVLMLGFAGSASAESSGGSSQPPEGAPAAASPGPGFSAADEALAISASGFPAAAHLAPDVALAAAGSTPVAATGPAVTHTLPWHWVVDFTNQLTSDPFVTSDSTICVNFKATHHTAADPNINITLKHNGSTVGGPVSYPTTGGTWQYCYHRQSTSGSYTLFFQKIPNGQQVTGSGSVENHS